MIMVNYCITKKKTERKRERERERRRKKIEKEKETVRCRVGWRKKKNVCVFDHCMVLLRACFRIQSLTEQPPICDQNKKIHLDPYLSTK